MQGRMNIPAIQGKMKKKRYILHANSHHWCFEVKKLSESIKMTSLKFQSTFWSLVFFHSNRCNSDHSANQDAFTIDRTLGKTSGQFLKNASLSEWHTDRSLQKIILLIDGTVALWPTILLEKAGQTAQWAGQKLRK